MAFVTTLMGARLASTVTSPEIAIGTIAQGDNGSSWMYVKASGAIAQYDYVCVDEVYTARAGTKTNVDAGHAVGFAQVAFADTEYGWVAMQGRGNIQVNVLASCVQDVQLYTSGTAGKLDDASTSQTAVKGVVIVATVTAAAASTCIATFPTGL